jgi:CHAP domain
MTIFTKQELLDRYLGKGFNPDGYAGQQCFDAPIEVARDMTGDDSFYCYVPDDKVCNWALNNTCKQKWLDAGFEYEENDFSNPGQVPPVGAFMVFNATAYNSWYGHTGIFIEGQAGVNSFTMMDQNAFGNNESMTLNKYSYDNVLGWYYAPQPIDFTKPMPTIYDPKIQDILAKYSNDFPILTQDWLKARFEVDGDAAGVEAILHDICQGYKNGMIEVQMELKKLQDDYASLNTKCMAQLNMPKPVEVTKTEQALTPQDKSLINGQSEVKSNLNALQGFVKNNISTITTLLGTFGITISQDQTSVIANAALIGIGFVISAYFEILNRKK